MLAKRAEADEGNQLNNLRLCRTEQLSLSGHEKIFGDS